MCEKKEMVKLALGEMAEELKIILQNGSGAGFLESTSYIIALAATGIVISFNLSDRYEWDQGRLPSLTDDEATNQRSAIRCQIT